jgi:hydroxymethylbilane synthase
LTLSIRLGTRGSALALWQANWTADQLRRLGVNVELVLMKTEGDTFAGSLRDSGGQGLFTKRLQTALLEREIDLAVHSLKDLPTDDLAGLRIAAVPPREDPADAMISIRYQQVDELPHQARVGTGSPRRQAQLLHRRPDLVVTDLRGNVDTRLKKLEQNEYDAIILAKAGLTRLGWASRISQSLSDEIMLPAVGQGALGLEMRDEQDALWQVVHQLDDASTRAEVTAERALLRSLRAGCLAPVGARATAQSGRLRLQGVVLSHDGVQRISASNEVNDLREPASLGEKLAQQLIEQGASELIHQSRT